MRSHRKKMIAPVVITAITVLYYILYFVFLIAILPGVWKYALGVIPLAIVGVMVKVCTERIREIRKGEEDDLSQY